MPKVGKMEYAKIYKITCNVTGKCYIGSTTERLLSRRLTKHVASYKRWKNGKYPYVTSFEILKNDDYEIELIQAYPDCGSKDELHMYEKQYIKAIDCVNKVIPNRTKKEYYKDNKDEISEKIKKYYKDNQCKLLEYKKQKYTCECGGKYIHCHKSKHLRTNKHKQHYRNLFTKIEEQEIQYTYDDMIEQQLHNEMMKNYTMQCMIVN